MRGGEPAPQTGARVSERAPELRARPSADAIDGPDQYRFAAAGIRPDCILQPETVAAVGEAVATAAAGRLGVVPAGNGTHLDIGHPPRRYDVALSTRRLTRLVAHEAADLTVTVEAGMTVRSLAARLAEQEQWLPLDPPRADEMTIGGMIAADRSGPLRFGFGKVRDWLLGLRVVMADGALVRGGGRVVKNVAGYDVPKLFAGSYGSLGVIVEATFKVLPRCDGLALFVWPHPALGGVLEAARRVLDSSVLPVLVEAVNEPAAESLGLESTACLVVGCIGSGAHLDEQARRLDRLSAGAAWRLDHSRTEPIRRALSDFSQPANEDGIVARISSRPTVLAELLPELETAAAARRTVAEIAAHAGSGVAWCQLLGAPDDTTLLAMAEALRGTARARGAWVVFESIPAAVRDHLDPWGYAEPALALMAGIKRALDPQPMFSPGRFVGRL